MKHKLKKWHIALMSFLTLFVTIFASLFSLRADTVDEETGEIITDNWELGVVFYDSTVDNGTTPLTEINWDASDGGYEQGTPRVIIVQINYKNDNTVTTYQQGELEISIPNLVYGTTSANSAQWTTTIIVGANDPTHTGYDWNYFSKTGSPSESTQTLKFYNANTIEEKSNFEGSIQIIYTITPRSETPELSLSCIHNYNTNITASLNYFKTETKEKNTVSSNEIIFNYTRTYIHNWKKYDYPLKKTAEKISSFDGLGSNAQDYIWVKYKITSFDSYNNYTSSTLTLYADYTNNWGTLQKGGLEVYDELPEGCIAYDSSGNQLTPIEGNKYKFNYGKSSNMGGSPRNITIASFYVGYPKLIYNEENNNLNITNTADLYAKYYGDEDFSYCKTAECSLNLAEFEFEYTGELYSISKEHATYPSDGKFYSKFMLDPDFFHSCSSCNTRSYHVDTNAGWSINSTAVYTGTPLTVRIGDDLVYVTGSNGTYRRLQDNEYWITSIAIPSFYNKNSIIINKDKYNTFLYVRYEGDTEYSLYSMLTGTSANSISFENSEKKVVAFYIQIDDMLESLMVSDMKVFMNIKPQENLALSGNIYNFDYINVFSKTDDGSLVLINNVSIDNYTNLTTQDNIASYDIETYGHYMQRATIYKNFYEYKGPDISYTTYAYKNMKTPIQDAEKEKFTVQNLIGFYISSDYDFYAIDQNENYVKKVFFDYSEDINFISGYRCYDLLPKGMELDSTVEEMLNSITKSNAQNHYKYFYKKDKTQAFTSETEFIAFIKNHSKIEIIENWNRTGRTKIEWIVNFPDCPLLYTMCDSYYLDSSTFPRFYISYDTYITYDNYIEYGKTYQNYNYVEMFQGEERKAPSSIQDTGRYDSEASDINENGITNEYLSYATAQINITSVISTHQDVTTYVQTDQSNYSTGIVDASCNSEYEYKLRVRTGSADVTNLVIYTSIEEAQPNRTRWHGEFLGIDTTYAESKGYIVKPYYSKNSAAGNLYNEEGSLNPDWKEYNKELEAQYANGLRIKFNEQCKTYNSSDYFYIYYYQDGKYYRSPQYYGTNIAGLTVEIPSTNFYIYWYSNSSSNNAYGFSIDSIEPICVTNPISASSYSLPSTTPIETTGNNYPETEHNPYNNTTSSQTIMWHYTYTDSLLIKEKDPSLDNVKSLAFEYLDSEGNPAILPTNSLTYVTIQMKSPDDENIKTLARMDCRTQWNAIDEFNRPVDFITGINSNVVKVALPNSIKTDDLPSISLKFTKEITGTDSQFENMKLDKAVQQTFMIRLTSLTANDDGTYNQVTALLKSDQELIISQIPVGTYLLEELGDNYFDFVDFTDNNDPEIIIEGVTLEKTLIGYILTVSEDLSETVEFNIKVTNEIKDERFYEDKDNKENLFLKNKIEEDSI